MKKIFPIVLLLSCSSLCADETDILLTTALADSKKELIEDASVAPAIDKKIDITQDKKEVKVETEKSTLDKKPKKKDIFWEEVQNIEDTLKTSATNTWDHMDKMWNLVHKEIQSISSRFEEKFKEKNVKDNKKQFIIKDKDNTIIMKLALPKNLKIDDAMIDVIDNKHFKVNLHSNDALLNFSGLITKNIVHIKIYSEEKQINKNGDIKTSRHESSFTHPLIGRIKDLERNIFAEYDADTHEMIITLCKETHSKVSIKVLTR